MKKVIITVLFALSFAAGLPGQSPIHPLRLAEFELRIQTIVATPNLSSGPKAVVTKLHFGRRDGSVGVRTTESVEDRTCTTTTVWDITAHERVTASDCVSMKSTYPINEVPRPAMAFDTCVGSLDGSNYLGKEEISGLIVEKFSQETAGASTEMYLAPQLGCLQAQATYRWRGTAGAVASTTEERLASVKLGSVDSRLFAVGSGFSEALPSARLKAVHAYLYPGHSAECCSGGKKADEEYVRARGRASR